MNEKSGKILIVSYYLYPKYQFGGGRRMYFVKKYMEAKGYSADIISADFIMMNNRIIIDRNNSLNRHKRFHSLRKYNPMPDSMFIWSVKAASLIRRNVRHYDAVIISGPPFSLIAALFMRLHVKHVYIADIRDIWADGALQEYAFTIHRIIDRFVEKRSFMHMEKIISATKGIGDIILQRYRKKSLIMYNMLDAYEYSSDTGENGDYLVYAGKIDRLRKNNMFFDAVKQISNVNIVIAGSGNVDYESNIVNKGVLPRNRLLQCVNNAKAGVILISFQSNNEYNIFTSKLLDYVQLRKPVLYIGPRSDASEFIERERIGISVTENSHNAIKKGIERIIDFHPEYTDELISRFHYMNMIEKSGFADTVSSAV